VRKEKRKRRRNGRMLKTKEMFKVGKKIQIIKVYQYKKKVVKRRCK